MDEHSKLLQSQVLLLPETDRLQVVVSLLESLEPAGLEPTEWTRLWKDELNRREQEIASGRVSWQSWERTQERAAELMQKMRDESAVASRS